MKKWDIPIPHHSHQVGSSLAESTSVLVAKDPEDPRVDLQLHGYPLMVQT